MFVVAFVVVVVVKKEKKKKRQRQTCIIKNVTAKRERTTSKLIQKEIKHFDEQPVYSFSTLSNHLTWSNHIEKDKIGRIISQQQAFHSSSQRSAKRKKNNNNKHFIANVSF